MPRSKFVEGKTYDGTHYAGSRRHKELGQRDTLEASILNLAELAGIRKVERVNSTHGLIYRAGSAGYMSASNLILELTIRLVAPLQEAEREASRQKRMDREMGRID